MRFITEQALRDLFAKGVPDHYQAPDDARLTPAARQYLGDLGLCRAGASDKAPNKPSGRKPEHMTHLEHNAMACKSHPRIALRGKIDTLESELLIVMHDAPPWMKKPLSDALTLIRNVLAADFIGAPLSDWTLDGMDEQQVHRASHHPEEFGYAAHILPDPSNSMISLQINRLRALTRETELAAVRAFMDGDIDRREDLVLALNRISSFLYVLELRSAAREE